MDTTVINVALTFANVVILLGNIVVMGLSLKLYTEYIKDKNMDNRMKK